MKVLITGATGFIGKYLAQTQKEKNYDVYCLVRKTSNIDNLKGLGIKFIYGDLTRIDSLYRAVSNMDYIYHLAIARFPQEINTYYQVNHIGTENLIKACVENNYHIRKFIYVSSLAAAGYSPNKNPLKETDPPHPVTHYGKSKLMGEKAVLNYKDRLPVVIIRPPTVYGPKNMLFNYLFTMIKSGLKPIWDGYTSLCYIQDLIDGLILAGESKKAESKVYFICDGNIYSWKQIIQTIASYLKTKTTNIYIPHSFIYFASYFLPVISRVIKKPYIGNKIIEFKYRYWICDASKIEKELGFKNKFDLESGIQLWFKQASI